MIFEKVRIFDLAKVLCFFNQNAPRQMLFMFDIFRLKPFFSADLGKFLPMFLKLWFFPFKVAATYRKPTRFAHFCFFHACAVLRGHEFLRIL